MATAVTSAERALDLRRKFELMLSLENWGSDGALDRLLVEISKLPHTAERERLENDVLDLRLESAG